MVPGWAQVRSSACKGQPGGSYTATFAWGPHETGKTFEKLTPYLPGSLQIWGSFIHAEDWEGKMKKENAAAPVVTELSWIISYFINASPNPLQRNNAVSNSWLHCFLLQIQMTIQLSPIWGSKQEINPLLCTSVFSRVSMITIISFFFGCLSISILLQLFFLGKNIGYLFRF